MTGEEQHAALVERLAKLQAHKEKLQGARRKLRAHAAEQLDTLPHAIQTASDYLAKGKGGVLTHRYLRTRLIERERLHGVVFGGGPDEPEDAKKDDDDEPHAPKT